MFYLKDKNKETTTIEAVIRFKGQRYKISTGEKVEKAFWNAPKFRCKEVRGYPDGEDINIRLDEWEKHIKKVKTDFLNKFTIPTQEEFRQALKIEIYGEKDEQIYFIEFAKEYKIRCGKSESTTKTYQTTINWLEGFEKEKKKRLKFHDLNSRFYESFEQFLYKSEKVNSPNFIGTLVKNIKVFINAARKEKISVPSDDDLSLFKSVNLDTDNIYLTIDELTKIHRLEITEDMVREELKLTPKPKKPQWEIKPQNIKNQMNALELARGRFLIGSLTALRVSDYNRIESIGEYIRIRTKKGDRPVVIPVHWIIKEIISKGYDLSKTISDQKLNKQIKTLCKYAGITELVTLTKFEKGKRIEVTEPKYKWVTTHTARRSGATNMFKAGIPTLSIMKITGHRTEKSFLKYIKVTQEENAEILAKHPFFNQ